jgi:hypothetical protein
MYRESARYPETIQEIANTSLIRLRYRTSIKAAADEGGKLNLSIQQPRLLLPSTNGDVDRVVLKQSANAARTDTDHQKRVGSRYERINLFDRNSRHAKEVHDHSTHTLEYIRLPSRQGLRQDLYRVQDSLNYGLGMSDHNIYILASLITILTHSTI